MAKVFNRVASLKPGKSVFNLSYEKKLTCDMGQLIPVMCDEVVPGDIITLGNQMVVRMQPMVAPILHEINVYTHYFFVPYRLLWDEWEDFITGGVDGDLAPTPPTWDPGAGGQGVGTLWDYFGFPIDVQPTGAYPLSFPRDAYNFIYNEYYRDETLIDEVLLTQEDVLYRCWEKDYFTSSLPWQQRGVAPALPISGSTVALWDGTMFTNSAPAAPAGFNSVPDSSMFVGVNAQAVTNAVNFLNRNTIDLSAATTFNVADLRLAFQIQKWLERNARAGARYTEFLKVHFDAYPRDERLQRPEYIGGSKTPVIISEVLQTSSTDVTSPQGNLAGHGITGDSKFIGKYRVQEFGLIMGIMSIMPRSAYQQGIDRQWLRRTKYDFYFPEFAHLSEQAIENAEIMALDLDDTHNLGIFGYQGRYDEMRIKRNMVCGEMRGNLDYWHLGRIFDPMSPPELNEDFLICNPDKRIFAVETEPGFIINYANLIKAIRPMPIMSNPGMIDH